jgi:hypothetical protein
MTPEGKVKAKVKLLLKKHGAWSFLPVSGGLGAHGIPDVIACHCGKFIGIECKAPGKKDNTTALQRMQIDGIKTARGIAMVVADADDLGYLDSMLRRITDEYC